MTHSSTTSHVFQSGDSVYFFDPDDGASSGYYTICVCPAPEDQDDGTFLLASQAGSEIEALHHEIVAVQGINEAITHHKRSKRLPREVVTTSISMLVSGAFLVVVGMHTLLRGSSVFEGMSVLLLNAVALLSAIVGIIMLAKLWWFLSVTHLTFLGRSPWWGAPSYKIKKQVV